MKKNNIKTLVKIWKNFHKYVMGLSVAVFALTLSFIVYRIDDQISFFSADITDTDYKMSPLGLNEQCEISNQVQLKVSGGSGNYDWGFIGNGVNGQYGTLVLNENNQITRTDEVLSTTENIITYIAPPGSLIEAPGSVMVKVSDKYAVDKSGNPLDEVFTINLKPSCVKEVQFVDPDPLEEHTAKKGVAFTLKTVKAVLYNGMEFLYEMPHPRLKALVNPPQEYGYFESYRYFYPTRATGNVELFAVIDPDDPATAPGEIAASVKPLSLVYTEPECGINGKLVYGQGGASSNNDSGYQLMPIESRMKVGENRVIHVKDGKESYVYSSSDKSVVEVVGINELNIQDEEEDDDEDDGTESEEVNTVADSIYSAKKPVVTDYAVIKAVGEGSASIFVFDEFGCTAVYTVDVGNFQPIIEYAKFIGNSIVAKGSSKVLHMKVSDLDTIDDIIDIDIQLIKGLHSGSIPSDARTFNIIDYEEEIKIETEDGAKENEQKDFAYIKYYEIPILIPDLIELTDGYYTVLISIMDKRSSSIGDFNKVTKTVSIKVGTGDIGDIDGDGEIKTDDVIKALRIYSGQDSADKKIDLVDIISILRLLTGN